VTGGEVAVMVLNQGDCEDGDDIVDAVQKVPYEDDDIIDTVQKVSIDDMVKMDYGLIEGLEQREFITEQETLSVYKIKERPL
jgi:hypothetical protein